MAKRSNKNSKSKQKPLTPKAGYTRDNNSRRYSCGGKIKK